MHAHTLLNLEGSKSVIDLDFIGVREDCINMLELIERIQIDIWILVGMVQ
jgi:hypothetical protein